MLHMYISTYQKSVRL